MSRVTYIWKDVSVSVWTAVGNRSEEAEISFQRAQWARPVFITVSGKNGNIFLFLYHCICSYEQACCQIQRFGWSDQFIRIQNIWRIKLGLKKINSVNSSSKNTRLVWTAALGTGKSKMFTRISRPVWKGTKFKTNLIRAKTSCIFKKQNKPKTDSEIFFLIIISFCPLTNVSRMTQDNVCGTRWTQAEWSCTLTLRY